jgi:hypothetical protein
MPFGQDPYVQAAPACHTIATEYGPTTLIYKGKVRARVNTNQCQNLSTSLMCLFTCRMYCSTIDMLTNPIFLHDQHPSVGF